MGKTIISNFDNRVILQGGLGNQLFQFAFAHFLINHTNSKIRLENKIISYNTGHDSTLFFDFFKKYCQHLKFKENMIIDCNNIIGNLFNKVGIAHQIENLYLNYKLYRTIFEKDFDSSKLSTFFTRENQISFDGYWQNWFYVDTVKNQIIPEISKIINSIELSEDLSFSGDKKYLILHVRRGDYMLPKHRRSFGVVNLSAYLSKIDELTKNKPDSEIMTLTDDIDLLKNEKHYERFGKILGPQSINSWQALKLMSKSHYLMTANSSLSWWGGYLSMLNGGRVFIPKPWFKIDTNNITNSLLHPKFYTYPSIFEDNSE